MKHFKTKIKGDMIHVIILNQRSRFIIKKIDELTNQIIMFINS